MGTAEPRNRFWWQHLKPAPVQTQQQGEPQRQRGSVYTPIIPLTEFLFHADPQRAIATHFLAGDSLVQRIVTHWSNWERGLP